MPQALPIVLGAAVGAGAPYLGAVLGGVAITDAVIGTIAAGALLGALLGALPLVLGLLARQHAQTNRTIDDIQINTYSRVARVPITYGFRRVGTQVLDMTGLRYEDVVINATGRTESHLFGTVMLGLGEGPCRQAVAFYIQDTLQRGGWRFIPGTADDQRAPEFDNLGPNHPNPPHKHTAKIIFSGDMGNVSAIPDFAVELRGIYPDNTVTGTAAVTFRPTRAGLDGPSNTLWILPASTSGDYVPPLGVVTYRIPYASGAPTVTYTPPPDAVTDSVTRAWYAGRLSTLVMQDPANGRRFWFAPPGTARDSEDWLSLDMGAGYARPILLDWYDDRSCRLHTLHQSAAGAYYILVRSLLSADGAQIRFPSGLRSPSINAVTAMCFKPEDNSYWFVSTRGDGAVVLSSFHALSREWRERGFLAAGAVVGVVRLGVYAYVFRDTAVSRVDLVDGTVTDGLPLTDFMSQEDADAMAGDVTCLSAAPSAHRYAGVAVFQDQIQEWRVCAFHEQRGPGEVFTTQAPFRRWMIGDAGDATYIAKPGWPATVPPDWIVWVNLDPVMAATSVHDMVARGADYKSFDPAEIDNTSTLGTGLTAYSWFPIRHNATEPRRVVLTRPSVSNPGLLDWWFGIKGGIGAADRDFSHNTLRVVFNGRLRLDSLGGATTAFLQNAASDVDGIYVGMSIRFDYMDDHFPGWPLTQYRVTSVVTAYDGAARRATFAPPIPVDDEYPFASLVAIVAPLWDGRYWTVRTPTLLPVPEPFEGAGTQPPFLLEGRYFGRSFEPLADVQSILDLLGDRPDANTEIDITTHAGTYDLSATTYSGRRPLGPDMPLTQYRISQTKGLDLVLEIAASLNEVNVPDVWLETSSSGLRRRDVYGVDDHLAEHTVASDAMVASWESTFTALVHDEKTASVTITVNPAGYRHRWFEKVTTPAAIRWDYLSNHRYGRGAAADEFDVASFLSLHGYSMERVAVGADRIRRYAFNLTIDQDSTLADLDAQVLSPAMAFATSAEGRYSVAFESGDTQPVLEFDASMIQDDTFAIDVKSPRTAVNRVRGQFYNMAERRTDDQTANDEHDQDVTGETREQQLPLLGVTDSRRAAFLARQALEAAISDRHAFTYITGSVFRMILNLGDVIAITRQAVTVDPSRVPARLMTMEDTGTGVQMVGQAVSTQTVDTSGMVPDPDAEPFGGQPPISTLLDRSQEQFNNTTYMPVRGLAARRDTGQVVLLAHRDPRSSFTAQVVAKPEQKLGREFDNLVVTPARSAVVPLGLSGLSVTAEVRAVLDPGAAVPLPANAFLVKRVDLSLVETVETVRVTSYTPPSIMGDPDSPGAVTLERRTDGSVPRDTGRPLRVFIVTEDPDEDPAELTDADGAGVPAYAWKNPGLWTDITSRVVEGNTADPVTVLESKGDWIVIGVDPAAGWLPNALRIDLSQVADTNQHLVAEYSCNIDHASVRGVWKPLSLMDGTQGLRRSGFMYFEIPPAWRPSAAWDRHGNRINLGAKADRAARYYIRIQRRQRTDGDHPSLDMIRLENHPYLVFDPPNAQALSLPDTSRGLDIRFRFAPRSSLPVEDAYSYPFSVVRSSGERGPVAAVTDVEFYLPSVQEIVSGGSRSAVEGTDYGFRWAYASETHGLGAVPFGSDVLAGADDPFLGGVVVRVLSGETGATLRRDLIPYPINHWLYTAAMRDADQAQTAVVEIRQIDDKGIAGPPFIYSLQGPGVS